MIAKYGSTCVGCWQKIARRDVIYSTSRGWMHRSCSFNYSNEQFEKAQVNRVQSFDPSFTGKGTQLTMFGGE